MSEIHLAVLLGYGPGPHTIGQWRLPRSFRGYQYESLEYWEHIARTLERGCFDMLFLADGFDLHDTYGDTMDPTVRYAIQYPKHDVLAIIPAMARVTKHLGFGATISTTYLPPYYVARSLATLDHLTGGRIGWNVVTSYGTNEAKNFGLDTPLDKNERYDRADEFMEVCYALWDSWELDAVVDDRDAGIYANPDRVHRVAHDGEFFRCLGPLQVTASPSRRPVILQAGSSGRGLAFAARHAEACFAVRRGLDGMRAHRDAFDEAVRAFGGDEPRRILWGVLPVVAETEEVAQERYQRLLDQVPVEAGLALMSAHFGIDLSGYPLDRPLDGIEVPGVQGMADVVMKDLSDVTLAEVARMYGVGIGAPVVVGTPTQVADELEAMYDAGGGDGFMLITHELPRSLEDFVELVVPELQRRGRVRMQYETDTLRGHLALPAIEYASDRGRRA